MTSTSPLSLPFAGSWARTQRFGENPATYRRFGLSGHNGTDWALPHGTPVLAAADGTVTLVSFSASSLGLYVVVAHSLPQGGLETTYAHFSRMDVKAGDKVKRGQQLGLSGNTGFCMPAPTPERPHDGSHLHFGVRLLAANGEVLARNNGYDGGVDPELYLADWPYADVPPTHPYAAAAAWAKATGLMQGYADGRLGIDEQISVGRLLTVLQRLKK